MNVRVTVCTFDQLQIAELTNKECDLVHPHSLVLLQIAAQPTPNCAHVGVCNIK